MNSCDFLNEETHEIGPKRTDPNMKDKRSKPSESRGSVNNVTESKRYFGNDFRIPNR